MADRKTTTERGLGYDHQRARRRLMQAHIDGTLCPCMDSGDCGPSCICAKAGQPLPMYRTGILNADGLPLEADHTLSRSQGGTRADRLMLATCNRSRGAGQRRAVGAGYAAPWWSRDWLGEADIHISGD